MYSTLTSGFCSMKRLTLASTTWGSKAHPAKRTRAWPLARRGRPAIARLTPALARVALRRKARRETVASELDRVTHDGFPPVVRWWTGASSLDGARHEALHDQPLEEEG